MKLEDLRGRPGIYTIFVRDMAYVGSAMDLCIRLMREIRYLSQGKCHNAHLQSAYDKYGVDAVRLGDIKFCDVDTELELRKFELIMMNRLREAGVELFNLALDTVVSFAGRKHSEESKQKMHQSGKRNWKRPEYREKMRVSQLARRRREADDGNQRASV